MRIVAQHITKYYGTITAVKDLEFELGPGEIVGLVGSNGAGKTTALGILTGCITQSSGRVLYDGRTLEDNESEVLEQLGYLPEKVPVYPELTVRQQLAYCAGLKRRRPAAQVLQEVLRVTDLLDLGSQSRRLVAHLSKGYIQRLGLAQALLWDPRFIVLDEPMSGLDPKQAAHMRRIIGKLGEERTVLLSSHDLSEVQQLCTRVCILSGGIIAGQGTPGEMEEQLGRRKTLDLTLQCSPDILKEFQQALCDGIVELDSRDPRTLDQTQFLVRSDRDLRGEVNEFCRVRGISILRMVPGESTLEDIFMEITGREGQR